MPTDALKPEPMDFRREVYCLLGLPFDALDLEGLATRLRAAAAAHVRCVLSTPNINFVIAATRSRRFRDDILKSDLCVADGMPIIWMARWLGVPLPERVSGSDLFDHLVEEHGRRAMSVYFFGGEAGISSRAHDWVNAQEGGIVSTGHLDPGFGSTEILSEPDLIDAINSKQPDFLILSLGAEKGQAWIERNLDRLNAPIISHLGAVVKFAAGTVRRAPRFMRVTGLEWLWRMKEEPFLWRRYAGDAMGLASLMLGRSLRHAMARPVKLDPVRQPSLRVVHRSDVSALRLEGAWRVDRLEPLREALQAIAERRRSVALDLTRVDEIDSATIGLLLLLRGHCLRQGVGMRIIASSPAVQRAFSFFCVEYLFEPLERARPGPTDGDAADAAHEAGESVAASPGTLTGVPASVAAAAASGFGPATGTRIAREDMRTPVDSSLSAWTEQAPHS